MIYTAVLYVSLLSEWVDNSLWKVWVYFSIYRLFILEESIDLQNGLHGAGDNFVQLSSVHSGLCPLSWAPAWVLLYNQHLKTFADTRNIRKLLLTRQEPKDVSQLMPHLSVCQKVFHRDMATHVCNNYCLLGSWFENVQNMQNSGGTSNKV